MKLSRKASWSAWWCVLLLATVASAQDRQRGRQARPADDSRAEQRVAPGRDTASEAGRAPGLSRDERRQLRQDIHQAGREIYPKGGQERPQRPGANR